MAIFIGKYVGVGGGKSIGGISAPQNLVTSGITSSAITLGWDAVDGADHYEVYIVGSQYVDESGSLYEDENGEVYWDYYELIDDAVAGTSYEFTDLDEETEYTLGVLAVDANGNKSSLSTKDESTIAGGSVTLTGIGTLATATNKFLGFCQVTPDSANFALVHSTTSDDFYIRRMSSDGASLTDDFNYKQSIYGTRVYSVADRSNNKVYCYSGGPTTQLLKTAFTMNASSWSRTLESSGAGGHSWARKYFQGFEVRTGYTLMPLPTGSYGGATNAYCHNGAAAAVGQITGFGKGGASSNFNRWFCKLDTDKVFSLYKWYLNKDIGCDVWTYSPNTFTNQGYEEIFAGGSTDDVGDCMCFQLEAGKVMVVYRDAKNSKNKALIVSVDASNNITLGDEYDFTDDITASFLTGANTHGEVIASGKALIGIPDNVILVNYSGNTISSFEDVLTGITGNFIPRRQDDDGGFVLYTDASNIVKGYRYDL